MEYLPYIVAAVGVVVVGAHLVPVLVMRRMRGRPMPALDDFLAPEQRQARQLLFYFWSPSCGMCRNMTPVIEELRAQRDDILSVDITEHLEVARRFNVMATPTLALVRDGRVAQVLAGAQSRQRILQLLD